MKGAAKRWIGIVFGVSLVAALAGGWLLLRADQTAVKNTVSRLPDVFSTPAPPPPPPFSDPYFSQMADRLGLTPDGRDIFQRAEPVFAESIGLGPGLVGEVRGGQIRITNRFRGRTDSQAVKYVAHEYLHVVWFRRVRGFTGQSDKKEELTAAIDQVYRRYQTHFDQQIQVYNSYFSDPNRGITPGSDRFYAEMHSLLGTEVDERILPPTLVSWYQQWLPNRAVLPKEFRG